MALRSNLDEFDSLKLIDQIDNYGFDKSDARFEVQKLLGDREHFRYQENNSLSIEKRIDFINFLERRSKDIKPLHEKERQNPQKDAISLVDLLGKEGVEKFVAAIEEEKNSDAFRNAVLLKSVKTVDGPKFKDRVVVVIGGPSASGKSRATQTILENITATLERREKPADGVSASSKNIFVTIDGGIERDTLQMFKLVLQVALAKGYSGIKDLYDYTKTGIKRRILDVTKDNPDINLLIPATFSNLVISPDTPLFSRANQLMGKVSGEDMLTPLLELQKTSQVFFAEVGCKPSRLERFKTAVHAMGISRAFKYINQKLKHIFLNASIPCESKAYGSYGFTRGVEGSKKARNALIGKDYQPFISDLHYMAIDYDLIMMKKDDKGNWIECNMDDVKSTEGKFFISRRAYIEWAKLPPPLPDLKTWYERSQIIPLEKLDKPSVVSLIDTRLKEIIQAIEENKVDTSMRQEFTSLNLLKSLVMLEVSKQTIIEKIELRLQDIMNAKKQAGKTRLNETMYSEFNDLLMQKSSLLDINKQQKTMQQIYNCLSNVSRSVQNAFLNPDFLVHTKTKVNSLLDIKLELIDLCIAGKRFEREASILQALKTSLLKLKNPDTFLEGKRELETNNYLSKINSELAKDLQSYDVDYLVSKIDFNLKNFNAAKTNKTTLANHLDDMVYTNDAYNPLLFSRLSNSDDEQQTNQVQQNESKQEEQGQNIREGKQEQKKQ